MEHGLAEIEREAHQQLCAAIKPRARGSQRRVEILRAVDLDLDRMHASRRRAMSFDDVTAGKWMVEARFEPALVRNPHCRLPDPGRCASPAPIADDDRRDSRLRWRHGVAIDQNRFAVTVE